MVFPISEAIRGNFRRITAGPILEHHHGGYSVIAPMTVTRHSGRVSSYSASHDVPEPPVIKLESFFVFCVSFSLCVPIIF